MSDLVNRLRYPASDTDAYEAAVEAAERIEELERVLMSEWQDIATAPKDGTPVDLWVHGGRLADAEWSDRKQAWVVWGQDEFESGADVKINGRPTHWMPLPSPPAPSAPTHPKS